MKTKILIAFIVILISQPQKAHAQWIVTDVVQSVRGVILDVYNYAHDTWVDIKREYKDAFDFVKEMQELANQIQQIQQQYEMLERMAESAADFDSSSIFSMIDSLASFTDRVDMMFDQAEGIINTSGDIQDRTLALIPDIEKYTNNPEVLKNLTTVSGRAKLFNYKDAIKQQADRRKEWDAKKGLLKKLIEKNADAGKSQVKLAKLANETAINQLYLMEQIKFSIDDLKATIAIAGIEIENIKRETENESKRVMTYEPKPISEQGAGLLNLK